MKTIFLVVSVGLMLWSIVPYARDILKGTTKPNIVSWITWTLLTGIATAAEIAAGEYVTAIFTGVMTIETAAIVPLGLRYSSVRYTRFDVVCQVAAVVGIVLWQLYDSPLIGVLGAVVVDFIGALPTLYHAWRRPHEETWQTFTISAVGSLFAIAALDTFNFVSLSFALYIVIIDTVLSLVIIGRLRRSAPVLAG